MDDRYYEFSLELQHECYELSFNVYCLIQPLRIRYKRSNCTVVPSKRKPPRYSDRRQLAVIIAPEVEFDHTLFYHSFLEELITKG